MHLYLENSRNNTYHYQCLIATSQERVAMKKSSYVVSNRKA